MTHISIRRQKRISCVASALGGVVVEQGEVEVEEPLTDEEVEDVEVEVVEGVLEAVFPKQSSKGLHLRQVEAVWPHLAYPRHVASPPTLD